MIKVTSYKRENPYTYGLGATIAMEYLLKNKEAVKAIILHPDFRSEETISKIKSICANDIPVSVDDIDRGCCDRCQNEQERQCHDYSLERSVLTAASCTSSLFPSDGGFCISCRPSFPGLSLFVVQLSVPPFRQYSSCL